MSCKSRYWAPLAIAAGVACMSALPLAEAAAQHHHPSPSSMDAHAGHMHGETAPMHHGHGGGGPVGVMGDHRHGKGELMFSYRYMRMSMEGNLIGDNEVSPETIVTTIPNRFFGTPGQPPTLRVVPTEMSMDMHMLGAMYGVTDRVTLMGMLPYIEKEMSHITFQGMAGTNRLGTFTTKSEGVGDISLTSIIGLFDKMSPDGMVQINLLLGISAPTGSITERANVLAPNNTRPNLRLPYAMQLGSGTWDLLPGISATKRQGKLTLGGQYRAWIRLEDSNDEGYALGDIHQGTVWAQYAWAPWISTSLRLTGRTQDAVDGIDPNIVAPVQTADPDNYGGERVDLSFGVNLIGRHGAVCGHRLAAEFGVPIHQDLNGPQMEADWAFTFGWRKAIGNC